MDNHRQLKKPKISLSKYTQRRVEPQQDIQSLYKEYFENKRQRVCRFTAEVQETAEDYLDDEITLVDSKKMVVICSLRLPLEVELDFKGGQTPLVKITTPQEFSFNYFLYKDASHKYEGAVWVGWPGNLYPEEYHELIKTELQKYNCIPVFLNETCVLKYIESFLPDVYNAVFTGKVKIMDIHEAFSFSKVECFSKEFLVHYLDKITPLVEKNDAFLLLNDHYMSLIPSLLKEKAKIDPSVPFSMALFLQWGFPQADLISYLPSFGEMIIPSILHCHVLIFEKYTYVYDFFTYIKKALGLNSYSHKGTLRINNFDKVTVVRVQNITLNTDYIIELKDLFKVTEKRSWFRNEYIGGGGQNELILSMNTFPQEDYDEELLEVKFEEFRNIFEQNVARFTRLKIMMIACVQHPKQKTNEQNKAKLLEIAAKTNRAIREKGEVSYDPIIVNIHSFSLVDLIVFFSEANLLILETQNFDEQLLACLFILLGTKSKSVIASLNSNISNCLKSVEKVNRMYPEILYQAVRTVYSKSLSENIYAFDYDHEFITRYTTEYWIDNAMLELQRCQNRQRFMKLNPNEEQLANKALMNLGALTELNQSSVLDAYQSSKNRVFIIDYEGTLVPDNEYSFVYFENEKRYKRISAKPSEKVTGALHYLLQDPANVIFVVTGKQIASTEHWFSAFNGLGLAAEYGFFYKLNATDKNWCQLKKIDWAWMETVKSIMSQYVSRTDGSWIDYKKSGITWRFDENEDDFGKKQADVLTEHLRSVLEPIDEVDVYQGSNFVEVRPFGLHKVERCQNRLTLFRGLSLS